MFLDVLRRRNPGFIEAAMRLHQEGRLPANAYVLDLDAVEANARLIKTEADRLGLKVFAMTKQVGRVEFLLQGGHARRHRPVGGGRHGLRPRNPSRRPGRSAISATSSQVAARRSGSGGRCPAAGLLDGVQRRPRRARLRRGGKARRLHARTCLPASRPTATPSIAAMRAASTRPTWRQWPTASMRSTAPTSPASPLFRRCSSTRTSRKVVPTHNLATLAQAAEALARAGRSRHRGQRAGHHLDGPARRARRGRRDPDASRATGCTAPRRCMRWRICPSCRRCST